MCTVIRQKKSKSNFRYFENVHNGGHFHVQNGHFVHINGRHYGNFQNTKNRSCNFFLPYNCTFWPKISFLAQFLKELIHFVWFPRKRIWSSDPTVKPLYFQNFESKYHENENRLLNSVKSSWIVHKFWFI